ncbi:ABC transporter substrate-binding protein [Ornithinibacillus bavariensis]|uniref:ABC transporter substrate-binding protein n=1 Tax=Ornithinibacillus bavariensis TaxID=545502 RepID=A0A919X7K3_9BACI|nr:ABC transporter substrate-binding protein [Ornithinibacillus bavariensis]GIO26986.1 ABC transporter substrate-binding protein [Ornithinibacillus bavariensis]HAM80063.1 LacI family transcriptional regulator [Ornithinibacillus sp.]
MKKYLKVLVLLVLLIAPVLAACGSDDASSSEKKSEKSGDKYKVGILAPAVTHGWVAAVAYHAEARAKELSKEIDYQIYTSSNASEMTSQLDDLITWGADAIVAFPQWEGMEVPIQRALEEGIKVVNFDIVIDVPDVYRVAGDNYDMGVQGAKYIVDKIGKEGEVVILEVPSSGSVSELRKNGFLDTVKEIAPDLKLHTYATQFTREDGLKDFADILTSLDHIDAVYSLDDETSIGVLQAISEAGRTDIKVVTGGGGMQEYFNMMPENEDIWIQSALYSPAMVKDAVDTAVKILNGESVEKEIIIPTTVVDRDNYKEFLDAESPY